MTGDCAECQGAGWTVGVGVQVREACCGGSDWECGGRGCTGPVAEQVQVQVQEQCEACHGTGECPHPEASLVPVPEHDDQAQCQCGAVLQRVAP